MPKLEKYHTWKVTRDPINDDDDDEDDGDDDEENFGSDNSRYFPILLNSSAPLREFKFKSAFDLASKEKFFPEG